MAGGRPGRGAVGVAVVLVLAGFLFASNARLSGGVDARQAQDLPGLVESESQRVAELAEEVAELQADVERLTEAATADLPQADPQVAELRDLVAGRTPVTGPGLTVRLTDAPTSGPRPDWATNDQLVVHQQDLQAVINALWAGGAEAMTLQGQRVITTSAFRCVGNVLLLHGRTYSPPYVVRAIGDPAELREALLASPGVRTYLDWVDAVGLGFSQTTEERIDMPAYDGGVELRHADLPDGMDPFDVPARSS